MSFPKPSIPKGTRDFSPDEMARRNHIFDVIRKVFQVYGYQPLETPAMENLSTLMGKYGEEGDKLLFKILNSGNYFEGLPVPSSQLGDTGEPVEDQQLQQITKHISEKGLRYDLTVPFARFVVQHQHELVFPFKRYQIQPVWRADRPQKGRYREFYQCDVDVIGSDSLLNEIELMQIIDQVFSDLGVKVTIRINNRKILAGIAEAIGHPEKLTDLTVAVDKLDKIGPEMVKEELAGKGISESAIVQLVPIMDFKGILREKFTLLESFLQGSASGMKGLEEIRFIADTLKSLSFQNKFDFDILLARGLNYYTGTIFEVMAADVGIGSLCGGGRYDDLTGIFGLPGVSGVGVSFGADRIYDVMNELDLFPATVRSSTKVLFINFGENEARYGLSLLSRLHASGIPAEMYPDSVKLKKQMEYANRKKIPFVVLIGQDEIMHERLTVKEMQSGDQQSISLDELIKLVSPKKNL